MVSVVNDIDLCRNRFVAWNKVIHAVFGLFRCVDNFLQYTYRLECKHLQVVTGFGHSVNALPHENLQFKRYFGIDTSCNVTLIVEHYFHLLLICYAPTFRPRAVYLCGYTIFVKSVPDIDSPL